MKKIIILMIFLGLVSAISGGLLALVNDITAPIIASMSLDKEIANLEVIFPDTTYEVLEVEDETGLVTGAYLAKDKGYIFKSEVKGYAATPIVFMVGITNDGDIAGFKILSHGETSGIGSRIDTDEYSGIILGKTANDAIDTLAGATVSTKAVRSGIDASFTMFNSMLGLDPVEKPQEEEKPEVFMNDAKIISSENNVYIVSSKGFSKENEITISLKDGVIESVVISAFNDVLADGTSVFPQDYFDKFIGLALEDISMEHDVVTGASITSKSVLKAILKVAEEYKNATGVVDDGDNVIYTIEGEGYTFNQSQKDPNVFKVIINKTDGSIVNVEVVKFSDTVGLGDKATTDEYLATYVGKTLDTLNEIDSVAGATFTADSVSKAVTSALNEFKGGQ